MIRVHMRVDTSLLDNGLKKLHPNLKDELEAAATEMVLFIHSNWSPSSPSSPGSPPAVVTGALDASVRKDTAGRDAFGRFASADSVVAFFVRVGDEKAWYAADLEEGRESTNLAPRPLTVPALQHIEGMLPDGVSLGFKRAFR